MGNQMTTGTEGELQRNWSLEGQMNLHEAARDGNLKAAQSAVGRIYDEHPDAFRRGLALDDKDVHRLAALHYAVKYNHLEIVQLLIEKGAYVNVRGDANVTPLHYATRYMSFTDSSVLQVLLENEADINVCDNFGSTPLHYACLKGNMKAVSELLKRKEINIMARDNLSTTPLHSACSNGNIEIVDLLIEHTAEILAEDEAGSTPLHSACSQGHEELLRHLLKIIEAQDVSLTPRIMAGKNKEEQTLFHLAVLGSYVPIVKMLMERGSDVNATMEHDEVALHVVAVTGNREIVTLLLQNNATVDQPNKDGRTPLHKAAKFGKYRVTEMLLKKNADVNQQDNFKFTPLILAANKSGNSKTIQMLLKHGARMEMKEKEDRTALHIAVVDNHEKGVQTLLASPLSSSIINSADKENNTPLHIACKDGFEEIAIMLLDAHADVQARNNFEQTPLHLAAYFGQDDVVDNILDIKPSAINDIDREGNSPLHLAAKKGHAELINCLLKSGASINDKNTQNMTPLDCAAKHGQTDAVNALIYAGASVYSQDNGVNPLHLSSREGHAETTEVLLSYCGIGITDGAGNNALDMCIDNYKVEAAEAILKHRDWRVSLRNKTLEADVVTTPVRKMIKRLPDLASLCFDRCISESDHPTDDSEYTITLDYEFVDDTYRVWPCDIVRMDPQEGGKKGDLYTPEKIQNQMESKENHVFNWMVENKRQELLAHPLSMSLLGRKWSQFAAKIYYFKLSLYIVFLAFLTGYILTSAPLRSPYREKDCSINIDISRWDMFLFIYIGKYVVIILALAHMVFELFQLIGQRLDYFALGNLLEWSVFTLAVLNVIDDFLHLPMFDMIGDNGLICGGYQKAVGSLCIFLAWWNFVLFIQKVPVFGIYIVMLLFVISTFMKFLVVFVFLILAFGFSFYLLFHDHEDLPAFHSPLTALMKTSVMMTGELNFDDLFFSREDTGPFVGVTWTLFGIFVVIMVIILMNLLVGLAVDDIQAVQKQAELTKATMQIDIYLDAEGILPSYFRKKFVCTSQSFQPNKDGLPSNITDETFDAIQDILKQQNAGDANLTDNLKTLQDDVTSMNHHFKEIDQQLQDISEFSEQLAELKQMMADMLKYQRRRKRKPTSDDTKPTGDGGKTTVDEPKISERRISDTRDEDTQDSRDEL